MSSLLSSISTFDSQIIELLLALRSEFGVRLFSLVTLLGSPLVGLLIVGVVSLLLVKQSRYRNALTTVFGFLSTEVTIAILKFVFHRDRPPVFFQAVTEESYSLPSGHAATAAFVFGLLGFIAFQYVESKSGRATIILMTILSILVVDFSRLYLGVHYLSDVVLGNLIGGFFLWFSLHKRKGAEKETPYPRMR